MSDMKALVDQFPAQLREAIVIGEKFSMTKPSKEIRNILITGLGGSGISRNGQQRLFRSCFCK